jgi:hypothetical protein
MNLLPDDYKVQSAGEYIKMPGEGQFLYFAFLGDDTLVTGWEYWNKDNKPVRKLGVSPFSKEEMADVRTKDDGTPDSQKHVWWVYVYDVKNKKSGVLSISQKSVQTTLTDIIRSGDYELSSSIVKISGAGAGLKRTYTTLVVPAKSDAMEEIEAAREEAADVSVDELVCSPTPPVDEKVAEVM